MERWLGFMHVSLGWLDVVMRHADAGILLVRAQMTTSGVVSTALDRLGRSTVSGAVLNVFS